MVVKKTARQQANNDMTEQNSCLWKEGFQFIIKRIMNNKTTYKTRDAVLIISPNTTHSRLRGQ